MASNFEPLLHLANGDSTAEGLRAGGVAGAILTYPELYHEGPVTLEEDPELWLSQRADYFHRQGWASRGDFLERFRSLHRELDDLDRFEEVVLWFEHDLYDQLLLIRHLDWLSNLQRPCRRLSLICIAGFPGYRDFHGLGDLTPSDLVSLFPKRIPIRPRQLRLGLEAWRAFRSPDPLELQCLISLSDTSCLPHLAPALKRHLQEFPWTSDGLSRNHRQILQAVHSGAGRPGPLFLAAMGMEERPYLGDSTFFSYVSELCRNPEPLLTTSNGPLRIPNWSDAGHRGPFLETELSLTSRGRAVVEGEGDALEGRVPDRWLGGVHLEPGSPQWRWDEGRGELRRLPVPF